MRLIDADSFKNFIESLPKNPNGTSRVYDEASILRFIDAQPTAYDVEKVVEGLDEFAKLAEARWENGTSNHAYQEYRCWVKAIDIVKRGGVE